MACHSILSSSISSPSFFPRKQSIFSSRTHKIVCRTVVCCCNSYGDSQSQEDSDSESETKFRKVQFNLLKLSATLTVVSASLPQPSFAAKVSEKRRSAKKLDALTLQEYEKWSQGLPAVAHRLPYTEILDLKRENRLKRIIKPANAGLKQQPHVVLVVLEDSMVVRIVLPSFEADPKFWRQWDELKLDEACVNAYTPPLKKPEIPSPYLKVWGIVPSWTFSFGIGKPKPQSKKVMELKRMREEFNMRTKGEFAKVTKEKEESEKAIKNLRKIEERKRRREMKKIKADESFRQAQRTAQRLAGFWSLLARSKVVATSLGFLFFYIFYQAVVLNYRKQNKDYEDRLLIEKDEADERKLVRELEDEMEGAENEVGEGGGGQDEQHTQMKAVMQFMKSGARVRKALKKKFPEYMEEDVDVKFTDVAGLGKIREELEEIVKFFTHGDMYRRRGIRIPGQFVVPQF